MRWHYIANDSSQSEVLGHSKASNRDKGEDFISTDAAAPTCMCGLFLGLSAKTVNNSLTMCHHSTHS